MNRWLVAYDIPDNRRRTALANVLEDFGDRVQESVFEVRGTDQDLETLKERVGRIIEASADRVRVYPVCQACACKIEDWGLPGPPPFYVPDVIII